VLNVTASAGTVRLPLVPTATVSGRTVVANLSAGSVPTLASLVEYMPPLYEAGNFTVWVSLQRGAQIADAAVLVVVADTNLPPVITAPSTVDATAGLPVVLTPLNVADPDAGSRSVELTASVLFGALRLRASSGVTALGTKLCFVCLCVGS
jgi:hypothetical protein